MTTEEEYLKISLLRREGDTMGNNNIKLFKDIYEVDKDKLISLCKQAADLIRTRVDYTFILFLLFYKAISDRWEKEFEERRKYLISIGWSKEEAEKEAEEDIYHKFNFDRSLLWDNVRNSPGNLSEKLSSTVKKLEEKNEKYRIIFSQFDFHAFTSNPENEDILRQLVELFSKYSFKEVSTDILGDAYEWILKYFAPTKAKEGEVYTPREVIELMVEMVDPEEKKSLYDPALGSGGILIAAYKYLKEKKNVSPHKLCGQEVNSKTLAIAEMNLLLHDIEAKFELGDTLLYPKFKEGDFIEVFDYVLANPPWNQDGYGEETLKKGDYAEKRFVYGYPPNNSADWAWIQHMLASAREKVAIVLDTGSVSRGGREKEIRRRVIEDDLFECVVLLPEKLFYNTGAPSVIIIFNKKKPLNRKGKILLINASREYEEGKKQNTLSDENIKKIVKAYKAFKDIEKFSKVITIEDAKEADYNLSPSRFVSVAEEEEYRLIGEIVADLKKVEEERKKVEEKLMKILKAIK